MANASIFPIKKFALSSVSLKASVPKTPPIPPLLPAYNFLLILKVTSDVASSIPSTYNFI